MSVSKNGVSDYLKAAEMTAVIPVQNLYYLFLYAWDRLEEGKTIPVGPDESPELGDLIAKVLIHGVRHLLRRGLGRMYVPETEELSALRGRINLAASMQLVMTRRPRLACDFDELSVNMAANQILRTTMVRVGRAEQLNDGLRDELRRLDREFSDIEMVRLDASLFRRVPLHRNNAYYGFLLKVCELAFETMLPDPNGQAYSFREILRDEVKMPLIFQSFVKNFYRIEQKQFSVRPLQLKWDAVADSQDAAELLPVMTTDIFLSSPDRKIIIDTKYYSSALSEHHGKHSLTSSHLYQLFAYLKNARTRGPEYSQPEGILLYPAVGEAIRAKYTIQGHPVTAATVNLDKPWTLIRSELLALLHSQAALLN